MKLKTIEVDGKTYAEIQDGKPIYVHDDGKEVPFDAPATVSTISRLNGEAKGHREAKEAAEAALKSFEGVDAKAARDALDKLSKIDAKALVAAGDMDAAIAAAIKPYTEKLTAAEQRAQELEGSLNREMIGGRFAQSKFSSEKLTPAGVDLVRSLYGSRLKVENGHVVGYDASGSKIYSRSRPGEAADFDEIVEQFVSEYPHKDHILKGLNHNGGGGKGPTGKSGPKSMSRAEFDQLNPMERVAKLRDGFTVTDAA
jgi:hypothetical protein